MESFVLLGDSLFQHACSQDQDDTGATIGSLEPRLSCAYKRRLDVINRGFSGYNTRQVLHILSNVAHLPKGARFTAVLLGANDARLPNTPGGPQQHVPLAQFKQNIIKIVRRLRMRQPGAHIILITPPPVDERMTVAADSKKDVTLQDVIRRKAVVTAQYARAVREVGAETQVKVLDLWSKMIELACKGDDDGKGIDSEYLDENGKTIGAAGIDSQRWSGNSLPGSSHAPVNTTLQSYLTDGLHFSRKGYDLFYTELMALIGKHWPEETPERLPMAAPAWDEPGKWNAMESGGFGILEDFPEDMWKAGAAVLLALVGWYVYRQG